VLPTTTNTKTPNPYNPNPQPLTRIRFREGAEAMVQDNFNRCFSVSQEPAWNWNFYLAPMWLMGVIIRYAVLLPLRFTFIIVCSVQDPSPPLPPPPPQQIV